jgi:predicted nucleic acid-binding Zn ribbon protein
VPDDGDLGRPEQAADAAQLTRSSTGSGGKRDTTVDSSRPGNIKSGETAQLSTEDSGQPVDNVPEGPDSQADLVHNALADARGIARRSGGRDRGTWGRKIRRENLAGRRRDSDYRSRAPGYSGSGPDPERDPQPIGTVFAGYANELEWEQPLAEARVFADWTSLVGAEVAAHCTPHTLNAGELRIGAESTAWATQLRLLSSTLLARLVAELGPDVVTKLVISGPTGPSWKHGGRSVRGGRGPRDTYG